MSPTDENADDRISDDDFDRALGERETDPDDPELRDVEGIRPEDALGAG
jgi:hypothetical protein